jgi:hypothetical protein
LSTVINAHILSSWFEELIRFRTFGPVGACGRTNRIAINSLAFLRGNFFFIFTGDLVRITAGVESFILLVRGRALVDGIVRAFVATSSTLSFPARFKGLGYKSALSPQ